MALPAAVAEAAIPDAAGVFTACKLNGVGTVRLIDVSLPASSLLGRCTVFEAQISWSNGAKGDTGPQGPKGDPGASDAGPAPATIATLDWGAADPAYGEFAVGDFPVAVAFDGSSIWVANQASDNVTKLHSTVVLHVVRR